MIKIALMGAGRIGKMHANIISSNPNSKVEYVYDVNKNRLDVFYKGIQKYLPSIERSILKPGYSGIRPKLKNKGEGKSDFLIQGPKEHNLDNLVNLYGIESPGLTSSLSIADYVYDLLH